MILKAEEISKSYRGRKVVNNISIKVNQGEIVGLLGPNGSGKSTLYSTIIGENSPDTKCDGLNRNIFFGSWWTHLQRVNGNWIIILFASSAESKTN